MRHMTTAAWTGILLLLFTTLATGDEDTDHKEMALQTGEVASMEELLAKVRTDFTGHILEVELENDDDDTSWVYEVKVLQENGSVAEIEYDATTLIILDVEQGNELRRWSNKDD